MSELVERLAELTGHRDRDVMDVALVGAIRDILRPRALAIYRSVGEAGDQRWLSRARLRESDSVPTADPLWLDIGSLPRLAEHPARAVALVEQRFVELPGPQHLSLFPLSTETGSLGVLEIETDAALDAAAQRLVTGVLRLYRNFLGLLDYSERDTLTGLLNRKTFDESFLKATAMPAAQAVGAGDARRAVDSAGPHWLGMIDIDHFKRVNDGFGHLIGDEVLLLVARLIRGCFRLQDRVYRFGGEEFVVLMRCASDADAAVALERLRVAIAGYDFPRVGRITVSIGYTMVQPGDTPSSAFERADKAVYYAKAHGRDRVCGHAALVALGEVAVEPSRGDIELF
jgi:diguanylate cyclase (GGDEF)-like protein